MNSVTTDFRIGIIKEDGTADFIFSADDCSVKNLYTLGITQDISDVVDFYEDIKNTTYQKCDKEDKHLFYLKQYLLSNFKKEFDDIGVNPQVINDDLYLYYCLSTFNGIVMVNSSEHMNILILPSKGINQIQSDRLHDISSLLAKDSSLWSLADNMHIETFEEDGKTFGMLDVGQTIEGKFNDIIKGIEVKSKSAK